MVGAQAGLADAKGAFVQGVGAGQIPLVAQDGGEVGEAAGGGGVIESKAGLVVVQGALEESSCAIEIALGVQNIGQVVEAGRRSRVVDAQEGLAMATARSNKPRAC
jgi:hypothetical protein